MRNQIKLQKTTLASGKFRLAAGVQIKLSSLNGFQLGIAVSIFFSGNISKTKVSST
jgi:hypothetical protein